jgi:carboxyl-terminal processing protease
MSRIVIIPLLACVLFGAIPGVSAQEVQPPKTEEDNGYSQIAIFAKALELIRQDYVDENKTSYHDLVTAAMKGMLSSLDPHSQFMDPNDFRDMQDDTRSRFNGLGIEVSMKNGLPTVVTRLPPRPEFFPATKSCGSMACRPREWISRTRSMFCVGLRAQNLA